MKLIATRGLPGSGKTTRARAWVAEDPVNRARVNRDDLRGMCHDGMFLAATDDVLGTERAITAVRNAAITALLQRGLDVVADDTNLPSRTVRELCRLAILAGADFEIWDLTNIPYEECNAQREARERVPDEVIGDMWQRYVRHRPWPLPLGDEPADAAVPEPYVPNPALPAAILVDVDGTVALMGNRDPFDETRVHEDSPNWPVIAAVQSMAEAGYAIVFCSGRTEACRAETMTWLAKHTGVLFDLLLMRPAGDMRQDAVVKLEIFNREIRHRYNVTGVFDDRQQVVDMWRSLGLTVFQVSDGKF